VVGIQVQYVVPKDKKAREHGMSFQRLYTEPRVFPTGSFGLEGGTGRGHYGIDNSAAQRILKEVVTLEFGDF